MVSYSICWWAQGKAGGGTTGPETGLGRDQTRAHFPTLGPLILFHSDLKQEAKDFIGFLPEQMKSWEARLGAESCQDTTRIDLHLLRVT